MTAPVPVGCFVGIEKPDLQLLIDRLRESGYRVIGPTVAESAVVLGEIDSIGQLPVGWTDDQEAGRYRLRRGENGMYFDYVVGPHSLKGHLFPPTCTVLEVSRAGGGWRMEAPGPPSLPPLAVLGVRSCDLHAVRIQDQVFLQGAYTDPQYRARREGMFVVAVNCSRSAATCFCASRGTGPAVNLPADLVLTELPGMFVLEAGSERGGEMLAGLPWRPCTTAEVSAVHRVPRRAAEQQARRLPPAAEVRQVLLSNLGHGRWAQVGRRCLSCGNCTMVCPTCFCSAVVEVTDLSGDDCRRDQVWDSCFNDEHSYMNSGSVHRSTASRYRQWLTHKLATWQDQFGTPGCVGCGRCITWCPVGIDLTEEVDALGRVPLPAVAASGAHPGVPG